MKNKQIVEAMKKGLVVATGCTEPVAIAYAGAVARSFAKGEIERIELLASPNMIKNAFVVGIPGTELTGLKYAVAIGSMCTAPERKLAVLEGVSRVQVEMAKQLVDENKVVLGKADLPYKLYLEVTLKTTMDIVKVKIIGTHTNVTQIVKNGKIVYNGGCNDGLEENDTTKYSFDLKDIYTFCLQVDVQELDLIKQAIVLNSSISKEGLEAQYGLAVGKMIQTNIGKKILADDMINYAMMITAAASDARMAGLSLPVMSNSGSGNQGIAATMPVVGVWEKMESKDEEALIRACALSNLATIYIKQKFGVLSALCGAVVAASGAACGITYLLGGDFEQIENAIHNTLGNVAGIVCDGAKSSCALKISTCTNAAMQASLLALNHLRIKSNEGIVEQLSEKTIDNFAVLGNEGSETIDKLILDMIIHKE
ncbi:L-cysteine desulfidase family protein [Anaerosinus massiliensis]|uniref:L-cysteine desulfidase family protein n=1 Tax=Massilibacillus massiliensis TaxID=1806837 RepID=UPI000B02A458|nr:L-serine ammonia-lyase, iron-sulfur-dependent, subunit alpha [Massilibacillus massiliensis]